MGNKAIKIDRYDFRLEKKKVVCYAIAGKKEYRMPKCYEEMCDDRHLAIMERTLERTDVLEDDLPLTHYIPLLTE